jgi:hydroxymethylbilane synthase
MCATPSSRQGRPLADLAPGQVVGTSSLRRRAQLLHRRPDLRWWSSAATCRPGCASWPTGVADCTFLAMAGLNRLGMARGRPRRHRPEEMLPAVAQGAIGIERREPRHRVAALLARSTTPHRAAAGRRAGVPGPLDGSCETPIAGLAELDGGTIWLRGEILRPDGSERWPRTPAVAVRFERTNDC